MIKKMMKKFAAGVIVACALCLAASPALAWAAVQPGIELAPDDETGTVQMGLTLPGQGRDDVRALKVTIAVDASDQDGTSMDFAFADALDGVEVRQVRASQGEGVRLMSVYVATKDRNLFAEDRLDLGSLALSSQDGAAVAVQVQGFEAVNAAHASMTAEDAGLAMPEPLTVQVPAAGGETPNPPAKPGEEGDDPKTEGGDGPGGSDGAGGNPGEANVSPGAPSGEVGEQATPLATTGDGLLAVVAASAGLAAAAASLLVAARRRCR